MEPVSANVVEKRLEELEAIVAPYGSALVAFSGGVDSSLALAVAARTLPKGRVLAVTSNNETYLSSELEGAKELGVVSPLAMAGLGKAEVRELAKYLGLPSWNKPALACLSSRFPYGQEITQEKLAQVARAEEFMRSRGYAQVRVRHHGEIARLEVGPGEMERAFAEREEISAGLKAAGFLYVALDLDGYTSGSLNAVLNKPGKKAKKILPVIR